jgi:CDP-diglyceride synthetase
MMMLWNPIAYLATYIVLAAPGPADSVFRNMVVLILLLAFSPLFTPIGEGIYSLIARHRRRLTPEGSCRIS